MTIKINKIQSANVDSISNPIQKSAFRGTKDSVQNDTVELSQKKETSNGIKIAIGLGTIAAIVTLGILGRKGKLGSYIQELLGGAKKETEQIKDSLEKLLEKYKEKKISELTTEEKNKIMEALNPENKAEIKTQIETEFETMKDKKVPDVVDYVKNKFKEAEEKVKLEAEKAAREAEEKARLEAEKAAMEAEEKAKRIEEGKQKYEEYNQKLDGVTHFNFNNKKNEELTELGKYYHDIELARASELKRRLAAQAEEMKWFDSYLQDEPLRKALGIADDAEVMFTRELSECGRLGRAYIKNQKGNILTYDRNKGIWNEWNATTIENLGKEETRRLSQTKQAEGLIVTKTRNHERGGYDYLVRNLETGNETAVRDGRLFKKLPDGTEEEYSIFATTRGEVKQGLNEFFAEAEPTAPKRPPYGGPTEPPAAFVTVKAGKKQKVLNDIEAYVRSFDEGTFQRVNKNVVVYNANGEREVINIIYEGIDCDIDSMGRILPKLKVDPMIRRNTGTVSSSSYNHQRNAQRTPQRRMVHA